VVRIHSPRPILSITCKDWTTKQPTQLPTQFQSCPSAFVRLYFGQRAVCRAKPAPRQAVSMEAARFVRRRQNQGWDTARNIKRRPTPSL
jgi:hypothetical protein